MHIQKLIAIEQHQGCLGPGGAIGFGAGDGGGCGGGVAEFFFDEGGEEVLQGLLLGG